MAAPCCPWLTIFGEAGVAATTTESSTQQQIQTQLYLQQANQHSHGENLVPPQISVQKSYAEVLNNSQDPILQRRIEFEDLIRSNQPEVVDVDKLPVPTMKGSIPSIKLSKEALDRGKNHCKFSLVGRADFKKMSLDTLRKMAGNLWKPSGDWYITPLGKGFFMLRLCTEEEMIRIWSSGPYKFNDQVIGFRRWTTDFDPDEQRSSNSLVWVRFPKLKQHYWDYEALMTMGKALGKPIGVDQHTLKRDFGFFAMVLVDIDLSIPVPHKITVELEDGAEFSQEVEVPKMPKICSHCKSLGHVIRDCKGLQRTMGVENRESNVTCGTNNLGAQAVVTQRKRNRNKNRNRSAHEREVGTSGGDCQGVPIPIQEEDISQDEGRDCEQTQPEPVGNTLIGTPLDEAIGIVAQGEDDQVGTIGPDTHLHGQALTPITKVISTKNSFEVLNPTDVLTEAQMRVVNETEIVSQRMADFLSGKDTNIGGDENQHCVSQTPKAGGGKCRGSASRTDSTLGLRRSQRDPAAPVRLNLNLRSTLSRKLASFLLLMVESSSATSDVFVHYQPPMLFL